MMSEAFIEFGAHTILIVIKSVAGEPIVHVELHPIVELIVPEVTSCDGMILRKPSGGVEIL